MASPGRVTDASNLRALAYSQGVSDKFEAREQRAVEGGSIDQDMKVDGCVSGLGGDVRLDLESAVKILDYLKVPGCDCHCVFHFLVYVYVCWSSSVDGADLQRARGAREAGLGCSGPERGKSRIEPTIHMGNRRRR